MHETKNSVKIQIVDRDVGTNIINRSSFGAGQCFGREILNMKFAYKTVNSNKSAFKTRGEGRSLSEVAVENRPAVVSFILVAKNKLCFRECAQIVKIAEDTGCVVEIASGTKSGDTSSILSLVNLGIVPDKSLVLTIRGENNKDAFARISKIISGETKVDS